MVVVTARKTIEKIQTIPESIQALGSRELVNAHVTRIDDLGDLVSNLNITTRADQTPDVVLRGVGSFGVVNGVGFYSDDVQLFDGQTVRADDLSRVEVLKGPQGTLYGGSNIGGAIKFITKLPTDYYTGDASIEYGAYNTRTFSAAVSGPIISDKLGGRLSFFDSATDGYIYDPVLNRDLNNGEERGGRLTLQYKDGPTNAILYLYAEKYDGNSSSVYYRPSSPTDYSLQAEDGTLPEFHRGLYSGTLNVDRQLGGGVDLTSISSYFHSDERTVTDIDKGPFPFLTGGQDFSHNVYTEELRLAGSGGPLKWLVGGYFEENDPNELNLSTSFNGDPSNSANFLDPTQYSSQIDYLRQSHKDFAIFTNDQYTLGKWTLELGLRGDYNESIMKDTTYGLSLSQHGVQVLPKISLSYNIAKDVMSYATISRGFEPGDVLENFDVNGNPILSTYKPETTWNYEIGLKSTLFNRVRFNAAAFYLDYADRLFQTNRLESGQFVGVTENIGPSQNYGVEADLSARLIDHLFLTASAGVTKAIWGKINFYDPDQSAVPNTPPVYVNLSGLTAPFTPAYSASVSLDWTHSVLGDLIFGARVDATAIGQSYWDVTDHFQQPAYQLVNLGVRLEGKQWTVSAHASNVFDVRYNTTFISAAEVGAPTDVASVGQPRLWSVALAYKF